MAREHRLPPSAASLTASMRDLGYSLETAVADLIDNSISAGSTRVDIFCDLSRDDPTLVIADDGHGMNADEMVAAMRHGASNPRQERAATDLGRFGLGLKTASFSQCRRLTVASSQSGERCAAEWNLDLVDKKDDWLISIFEEDEIHSLPYIDSLSQTGTIVVWRSLDRLFEEETGVKRDEIVNEKLDVLERHISLVFHRYLSGEIRGRKKLSISINGHPVEAFDPFCRKNPATQILPEEIIHIGAASVRMQPFILPHHSRLSAKEYDYYQDRSDFISNQGAYIYRNGRLMAWGDWFRLIPKGEATKLARVQIDFPSSLDESWTIDIKKSRARPPHAVRERLRQVIARVSGRSTTVHRKRGQKLFQEIEAPLWERYADQGKIRYTLNLSHPLVLALAENLHGENQARLELLLQSISSSLPIEMIYSDYSTHPRDLKQSSLDGESVLERLRTLKESLLGGTKADAETFREVIRSTRLFDNHMDIAEKFIREEFR